VALRNYYSCEAQLMQAARWNEPLFHPPLDRAPERGMLRLRSRSRLRDLLHRFKQVAGRARHWVFARRIEPASIAQHQLCVETVKLRRADGSVGARDLLRLVVQIRERQAMFGGECGHPFERVFRVSDAVVRIDAYRADAEFRKVLRVAHDA